MSPGSLAPYQSSRQRTVGSEMYHAILCELTEGVQALQAADENDPRSIIFQLEAISRNFDALPQTAQNTLPQSEEIKLILDMITRVKLTDMFALSASDASEAGHEMLTDDGPGIAREALQTLFTKLAIDLPKLSDAITHRYFSLTEDAAKRIKPRLRTQP